MPTTRDRLVRAVLGLYPAHVRDRYGAEIADLLSHSPKPARDLADVAWCAVADRGASVTVAAVRPHLIRLTGLIAAPFAFGVALAAAASVALVFLGALEGSGSAIGYRLADVVIAASVLPVVAATVWLARRAGRGESVRAPLFVVPTTLALGIIAVASLPSVGQAVGETWSAAVVAALCWYGGVLALANGATAVARWGRGGFAWLVAALGGFAVLELACTAYVLLVHRAYGLSRSSAFSAYPAVITGFGGDPAGQMADALKGLPALLTVCTAFTLTVVVTRARHRYAR
jgi:hypothetical protein